MKNKENICNEIDIKPFAYAISLIDGKWKMENAYFILALEKRNT